MRVNLGKLKMVKLFTVLSSQIDIKNLYLKISS